MTDTATTVTTTTPATTPASTPASTPETPTAPVFTADQQREINRLMGQARQEGREATERKLVEEAEKVKAEIDRKAAESRGEYDRVKADLERDRDAATTKAQQAEAELTKYREAITPGVTAAWTALPDELKPLYEGGDDDVLAKQAFLTRIAPLAAKLSGTTTGTTPQYVPATTPRASNQPTTIADEVKQARASGDYAPI